MELSTNSPSSFPPPSPSLQPPPRQQQFHLLQMEESEKLTALKKAYAEIIFNTTKEAAVRIMESERKASRFQQELSSAKEESLRILMRMKQMLDAKNNEAAVVCMSQQQKIEELEAQLNEAEDIVKELREELTEVRAELEQHKTATCQAELRGEQLEFSDAMTSGSYDTCKGSTYCLSGDSCKGHCDYPNPDFTSIMRRCKEPKLHKNGFTQRVRACEDNSCNEVQEATCKSGNAGGDPLCGSVKMGCKNMFGDVQFEVAQSINKRKQPARHSKAEATSLVDHRNHTKDAQNSLSTDSQDEKRMSLLSDNTDKGFVESQVNRAVRNPPISKRTDSFLKCQDHGEETQNPSCSKDSLDEAEAFVQSEMANAGQLSDKGNGFMEPQVDGDGNECGDALRLAQRAADSIKLEEPSLSSDLITLDPDCKFLKYTFQRKRKRDILCGGLDSSCSVEENGGKDNTAEKHSGSLESKTLSFTNESSQDSHQFVYLTTTMGSADEL